MRRATEADLPAIKTYLAKHIDTSMFPLANLANNAFDGDTPRAMRFWVGDEGVLGVSNEGMLMPQLPGASREALAAAAACVSGRTLKGALGETGQVEGLLAALGLAEAPRFLGESEPQFALDLDDLVLPDASDAELYPIDDTTASLASDWRAAYGIETLSNTPETAHQKAVADIERFRAAGSHRILFRSGIPVAMTGFNAQLPESVQIGGVYTPPALRNRGHARLAVGLHLAEARAAGARRAVLFAFSDAAVRAYAALGFRQIGQFSVILFDTPQVSR